MNLGVWKDWASALKKNTYALYLASGDPRVPLLAKLVIGVVVAYALSPIDLIPDFIPVIGYVDDVIVLPVGIWLAIRLIPENIWQECQALAQEQVFELPHNRRAGAIIVCICLFAIVGFIAWAWSLLGGTKST
jgi:uncharacterized membrane protein YkvA (DUF1232 family)